MIEKRSVPIEYDTPQPVLMFDWEAAHVEALREMRDRFQRKYCFYECYTIEHATKINDSFERLIHAMVEAVV